MKPVFRCLSLLVLWGIAHPLLAALPQTLNYQGRMRTSGGAPVPDSPGNTVVFRICADPSCTGGGDPLWTETWNSGTSTVDTKSGLFNVVLGTHNPITLPFDQQYYLEINFNSDGPMTPRQPLTMAPYAFNAKNIELPYSASGLTGGSPVFQIANSASGGGIKGTSNGGSAVIGENSGASGVGVGGLNTVGGGIGVRGQGLTGVAGMSNGTGGIGVVASQGSGDLALKAIGAVDFTQAGTVDFTGATPIGLPSAGESNTASNRGTGAGIFSMKMGVDLTFKSLKNTDGSISFGSNSDEIDISANNSTAIWNADRLLGRNLGSGIPSTDDSLVYDGSQWSPGGANAKKIDGRAVMAAAPSSDDVLVYNGGQWQNGAANAKKIDGRNVMASTPSTDDALIYDGVQWQNGVVNAKKIDGRNVVTGALTTGDALVYNGFQWVNGEANAGSLKGQSLPIGLPSIGDSLIYGGSNWTYGLSNANKLQGVNVANTSPNNGEVLVYSSSNLRWEPGTSPIAVPLSLTNNTGVSTLYAENPGATAIYGFGFYGVQGESNDSSAAGVEGRHFSQGTGVSGVGQTGTAGTAISGGGIGLLGQQGGGDLALRAIGASRLEGRTIVETVDPTPSSASFMAINSAGTGYAMRANNGPGHGLAVDAGKIGVSSTAGEIGVVGQGLTGTVGRAIGTGGIGVVADQGSGALALYVKGESYFYQNAVFDGGVTTNAPSDFYDIAQFHNGANFTGATVDFTGASVSGLPGVNVPLSLTNASTASTISTFNTAGAGANALYAKAQGSGSGAAIYAFRGSPTSHVGTALRAESAVMGGVGSSAIYATNLSNVYGSYGILAVTDYGVAVSATSNMDSAFVGRNSSATRATAKFINDDAAGRALEVSGGNLFGPGSTSFTSHVDFSGATITGWNVPAIVNAPLNLTGSTGVSTLFVTNTTGVNAIHARNTGTFATILASNAGTGPGVSATSASGYGMYAAGATGLYAEGIAYGIFGVSASNYGVYGQSSSGSPSIGGVNGVNYSTGPGVYGSSAGGHAVLGNSSANGNGVRGEANGTGAAVFGQHYGTAAGVRGQSNSGNGVEGVGSAGYGVDGTTYGYGFAGVRGTDSSASLTSTGVLGMSSLGAGVRGFGVTGTAGTANGVNGIGVLASNGGYTPAQALRVMGNGLFTLGSVTFNAHVDFSGATVTGWNVPATIIAPLYLTSTAAYPAATVSGINNGTGHGLRGIATAPGGSATTYTAAIDSTITAGVYGYSNASLSAGVLGRNDANDSQTVGVLGIANLGSGVYGSAAGLNAIGGSFEASYGTAVRAEGVTGVAARGQGSGSLALYAQASSPNQRAIEASGLSSFSGQSVTPVVRVLQSSMTYGSNGLESFANASGAAAVKGKNYDTSSPGPGGIAGVGVWGDGPVGVLGASQLSDGVGVVGSVNGGAGSAGVFAENQGSGTGLSAESPGGVAIYSKGLTGVSANTTQTGGVALQANASGGGNVALQVIGDATFGGPSSVSFTNHVDFTGATVTNLTVNGPVSATTSSSTPAGFLAANGGGGQALQTYGNNFAPVISVDQDGNTTALRVTTNGQGNGIDAFVGNSTQNFAVRGANDSANIASAGVLGVFRPGVTTIPGTIGGNGAGVMALNDDISGVGLFARANGTGGTAIRAESAYGSAIYANSAGNNATALSVDVSGNNAYGLLATTTGNAGIGLFGHAVGSSSKGVYGKADGTSSYGVYGEADDASSIGVQAINSYGGTALQVNGPAYFIGSVDVGYNKINSVADPVASNDAVNLQYLNSQLTGIYSTFVSKSGDNMSGLLTINATGSNGLNANTSASSGIGVNANASGSGGIGVVSQAMSSGGWGGWIKGESLGLLAEGGPRGVSVGALSSGSFINAKGAYISTVSNFGDTEAMGLHVETMHNGVGGINTLIGGSFNTTSTVNPPTGLKTQATGPSAIALAANASGTSGNIYGIQAAVSGPSVIGLDLNPSATGGSATGVNAIVGGAAGQNAYGFISDVSGGNINYGGVFRGSQMGISATATASGVAGGFNGATAIKAIGTTMGVSATASNGAGIAFFGSASTSANTAEFTQNGIVPGSAAVYGLNNNGGLGINGTSIITGGRGVFGWGDIAGVSGTAQLASGSGVEGYSVNGTTGAGGRFFGSATGVSGVATGSNPGAIGVRGNVTAAGNNRKGVLGQVSGSVGPTLAVGAGVVGASDTLNAPGMVAFQGTGNAPALSATSNITGTASVGIFAQAVTGTVINATSLGLTITSYKDGIFVGTSAAAAVGIAVKVSSTSQGIMVDNFGDGTAIKGTSSDYSNFGEGAINGTFFGTGTIASQGNSGVQGYFNNANGTSGYGVYGQTVSSNNNAVDGVYGVNQANASVGGSGVRGQASGVSAHGVIAQNTSTLSAGAHTGSGLYISGSVKVMSSLFSIADPATATWAVTANAVFGRVRVSAVSSATVVTTITVTNNQVGPNSVVQINSFGAAAFVLSNPYVPTAGGSFTVQVNAGTGYNPGAGDGFNFMVINQ